MTDSLRRSWVCLDRPVIGFLGSFYAYEGLDLAIAALPQMRKPHIPDSSCCWSAVARRITI